jgi:uncharacterized protein YqgV (UPF0045/DUF77 family)
MHDFMVNAALQILPVTQDKHPYEWVDEAIAIIRQSGIQHEVGPFATQLEGKYAEIMKVIDQVNEHLFSKGCTEWICCAQIQLRSAGPVTGDEKTRKFK